MGKVTRSRNGCITCKQRRRKCDETKPECLNCIKSGRKCGGYPIQLVFDVDDKRNDGVNKFSVNSKGKRQYGFRGRPRKDAKNTKLLTSGPDSQQPVPTKEPDLAVEMTRLCSSIESASNSQASVQTQSKPPQTNSLDNTPSSQSSRDVDITDPFQFENALYDGFDYLLSNFQDVNVLSDSGSPLPLDKDTLPLQQMPNMESPSLNSDLDKILLPDAGPQSFVDFIRTPSIRGSRPATPATPESAGEAKMVTPENGSEDNFILHHFFGKVIYLLDAHPKAPWPELMIRFCSFELARSCFLSLSSIHLFLDNGENEFYKKGVLHINNTMEYLMNYVKNMGDNKRPTSVKVSKKTDDSSLNVEKIVSNLKKESKKRKQTNFFVILLLLYVHILFAILESGRSALLKMFFKLFASIASDPVFETALKSIDQSQTLICVLSWFDTITALTSPDFRLPNCQPEWYGTRNDPVSTARMNGCPGEIFQILGEICHLRHRLGGNRSTSKVPVNDEELNQEFEQLKVRLLDYREYVPLELNNSFPYIERLKAAQCWALSGLVKLIEVCRTGPESSDMIDGLIEEFFSVYETLDSHSPIVTQMVWPVLNIGVHSRTAESRLKIIKFQEILYDTVHMGTIKSIMRVTKLSWDTGDSLDKILSSREWAGAGIDFIPC